MAGVPAPALLDPILVLNTVEGQGIRPQVMDYQMLMQSLAATGQIEAGLVLLARVEANDLLSTPFNFSFCSSDCIFLLRSASQPNPIILCP